MSERSENQHRAAESRHARRTRRAGALSAAVAARIPSPKEHS
jgi:hypothetical protein